MDTDGKPESTFQSFFANGNRTLLIKGEPGTGKTTLSLSLADFLRPSETYYISTRVSEEELFSEFPWLASLGLKIRDVRLGSPETLVEEYAQTLKHDGVLVILDSWDSFANLLDSPTRLKTEQALVALTASPVCHANTVFVSETMELTHFDYAVDGVIHLYASLIDGRRMRAAEIKKLRGTRVKRSVIPFTLQGGRVTLLPLHTPVSVGNMARTSPISPDSSGYSLGAPVFDEAFGRIPKGGVFSVEFSGNVPFQAVRNLGVFPILNFLSLGEGVVWIPHIDKSLNSALDAISKAIPKEEAEKRLRVLGLGESGRSKDYVLKVLGQFEKDTVSVRAASKDGIVVRAMTGSYLELLYSQGLDEFQLALTRTMQEANSAGDIILFTFRKESPIAPLIRSVSDLLLSMDYLHGVVVVKGEKPYTQLYALYCHEDDKVTPVLYPFE
jgi:KaiC/GvpD/RAD55 family RecA-like ATPase